MLLFNYLNGVRWSYLSNLRCSSVDAFSWPFAIALGTIALAVILTDIGRSEEADWYSWASSLALAALGLVAVLAGNLAHAGIGLDGHRCAGVLYSSALPQNSDQDRRNLVIHSFHQSS